MTLKRPSNYINIDDKIIFGYYYCKIYIRHSRLRYLKPWKSNSARLLSTRPSYTVNRISVYQKFNSIISLILLYT